MTTYAISFFLNRKKPTQLRCDAAADKAKRGGLKPMSGHFCGIDACTTSIGGCRIERQFGVACVYTGTFTFPKD